MASDEPYVSAKFKVWAIVTLQDGDEERFDDVVAISASFALNTIPTASLTVAVGTNPILDKKATIHSVKSRLTPRDKVVVKLTVFEGSGQTSKFLKGGTYTIFEGFFVGIGYQRSQNHANYVMHLTHWLDDLNNSSAINGDWFPGCPYDLAQTATYEALGKIKAWQPNPTITTDFVNYDNLTKDLWGAVIKPLFKKLADKGGGLRQDAGGNRTGNTAALAALDRMPGDGEKNYYTPLAFQIKDDAGRNLSNSIAAYFTTTIGTSFAQNTFWAKLITEYAAQFLFAVSPAVTWALPIPFCAGLRWSAAGGKTITASEYNYANFNSNMAQLIRSVDIAYPVSNRNGLVSHVSPALQPYINHFQPCAVYPPNLTAVQKAANVPEPAGLRLFKLPPNWASNTDGSLQGGYNSTTNATPTTEPAPPGGGGTALPPTVAPSTAAFNSARDTIGRFAQHWYVTEVLQQRYGEISGALRFDLAPGSVVKIMTPTVDTEFNATAEDPAQYVVASIMSVSYVINAERAVAGTTFAVAHTKLQSEMAPGSVYAVDTPPLYDKPWYHGPLAEVGPVEL